RAGVTLKLEQTELGRFGFSGSSEVHLAGSTTGNDNGPYAIGLSPSVSQPGNAALNAPLAGDPALQTRIPMGTFGVGRSQGGFRIWDWRQGQRPQTPKAANVALSERRCRPNPKSKIQNPKLRPRRFSRRSIARPGCRSSLISTRGCIRRTRWA